MLSDYEEENNNQGIYEENDTIISDESLGSDLVNIKETCENFFNIDKDNVSENGNHTKIRLKKPGLSGYEHSASSYPDLSHIKKEPEIFQRPKTQCSNNFVEEKTLLDYLKEEAEIENQTITLRKKQFFV